MNCVEMDFASTGNRAGKDGEGVVGASLRVLFSNGFSIIQTLP